MSIKIVIAAHKPYRMPNDSMYIPLHVGSFGKESIGFERDDSGENISAKNPYYCELTAVYWAWKNLDADYIGLSHYRRYFSLKKKKDKFSAVLTKRQAENLLKNTSVILPRKQKYYIENLYSHYAHTHTAEHLEILEKTLKEKHPEYVSEFSKLKSRTSAHMFNMFVMKKDIFDNYCEFLFDVLSDIERQTGLEKYDGFNKRFFGRISELLLDIWINTNHIEYTEVPVIYMEKINWARKIKSFLWAKFFGKKYNKSF